MNLESIKQKVANKKGNPLGIKKRFAVLLPLIYVGGELHILYQVRSLNLDTQPGEVSFPGGMVEPGETFKEAAIRETWEELNVDKERIKLIGEMDYIVSPYNFLLYPFIGVLEGIELEDIDFNKDEVEALFTVPLDFFLENQPLVYEIKLKTVLQEGFPFHMIQKGKDYNWREGKYPVHFYEYGDQIIWGMTARMTRNFIDILEDK